MWPVLEATGLKCGSDYFLAFSPEREDPGNARFPGGDDSESRRRVRRRRAATWRARCTPTLSSRWCRVSSMEVAEACKILENTYRAVNIALVNELKMLYDKHRHRRVGGHRRGQDQAVRLPGVLSRPGLRRTLHPDRSVLSHLAGAQARRADAVHRAGRRNQRAHAAVRRESAGRVPQRSAQADQRQQGVAFWAWLTRRTSTTRAKAPHSS